MMHGSLSNTKKSIPWSRADSDAYFISLAVGLLAGIVVTYARTPLHMPGHKVLYWMVPALVCRLMTRAKAGASTSALGTVITTLILDGQLGGGFVMMPLMILAGLTLDIAVAAIDRHKLSLWMALPALAFAGMAGNLICFIKRLFDPVGQVFGTGTLQELFAAAASYALFGFIAGLIGGIFGWSVLNLLAKKPEKALAPGEL